MKFMKNHTEWLLPTVLILFILEILTLPLVISLTYSGRSESPEHILSYTHGNLTWDVGTSVDSNGVAEFSLFDTVYQSVKSGDGQKVLAPGTEGKTIVRLKNQEFNTIDYVAVLYSIKSSEQLPVQPVLVDSTFTDTAEYPLPEGVDASQVLRAVQGYVSGGQIQDFDIEWQWLFEDNVTQDEIDTYLGNLAADNQAEDIKVGLYILVIDNYDESDDKPVYIRPQAPHTGDDAVFGAYLMLMGISAMVLFLVLLSRRGEHKDEG